jgi:hypothetical protein
VLKRAERSLQDKRDGITRENEQLENKASLIEQGLNEF